MKREGERRMERGLKVERVLDKSFKSKERFN
jgi:hypothetical protein